MNLLRPKKVEVSSTPSATDEPRPKPETYDEEQAEQTLRKCIQVPTGTTLSPKPIVDLIQKVREEMGNAPGKKDLHQRLTELTDWLLGPAPTMPIDGLVTRLEEAIPKLLKALEAFEESPDLSTLRTLIASCSAPGHERREMLEALDGPPQGPPCPICRGRGVVQGAFENPCHNCKGTGVAPQIPREAWKGYPLGECCIAGRCDGVRCECPCHPPRKETPSEPPKAESSVRVTTTLSGSARKLRELGLTPEQEGIVIGLVCKMADIAFEEGYNKGHG